MVGEDAGDEAGWGRLVLAAEVDVEVERGGAEEVAPPGGEGLGAGAVLGGEQRDDAAESVDGQVADLVGPSSGFARRWCECDAGLQLGVVPFSHFDSGGGHRCNS